MAQFTFADRLRLAVRALWKPQTISDLDNQLDAAVSGAPTYTGVTVGENTALAYTAVYACVRVRAEALSSLSLHLYRRDGKGAERATGHKLYSLMHDAPNPEMTAVEMLEAAQAHHDTWGNAYIWLDVPRIGRNAGYVQGLYPLKPDKVEPKRVGGRLQYDYRRKRDDGSEETLTYDVSQVLHIPALGYDGVMGYSPVGMARQAIGMGLALEEFGGRFFGQGTHPSGIMTGVTVPPGKSLDDFNEYLKKQFAGLGNAHKVMALTGEAKYTALTMPLEDAQFLATRKFQLAEIARIYRVPLHFIADLDKATFSNIEQQALEFAMFTIMPLARKWEKKLNLRLLTEREREQGYYFEFDMNSLMRGDVKSRFEAYKIGREAGIYSPNEIRALENMNPRDDDDGDAYWIGGPSGQQPSNQQGGESDADAQARLRATLRPVLVDAAARIHKRECADITAAAERYERKGDMGGFAGWLGDYWARHRDFCATALRPAYAALGDAGEADRQAAAHVAALECCVKAAATGGVDGVREAMEAREPADLIAGSE